MTPEQLAQTAIRRAEAIVVALKDGNVRLATDHHRELKHLLWRMSTVATEGRQG